VRKLTCGDTVNNHINVLFEENCLANEREIIGNPPQIIKGRYEYELITPRTGEWLFLGVVRLGYV